MALSQQYSLQWKYRAAWCRDPVGPHSAEGTRSLGTYAYSWCQTFKIFRKVQLQIANRSITRARLLVFFAGGCKTLQGRRSGCCLHSNTPACTCSENEACEPAVFFCRCRHLATSHLIVSSGEQSQLPFIFLRALVLAAVGNKTTCAQVPDRKWVQNCFALNRNYNDLPSWGWLSQANTLALTLESEVFLKGFAGDFIGFGILQEMTLLFSLSRVYFAFLFDRDALVKSWLLSEQMKCHPCCVPLGFSRQALCSWLWHIPAAAVVPAACRHPNLSLWRCRAFPAGALVFKDEHLQNRHDLAWKWVKSIHRVLAFWRHGASRFVVPTFHLQPFVS